MNDADIQCRDMYLIAVACMYVVCVDHNLYKIISIFTQLVLDRRQDQVTRARCESLPIECQCAVQELYNGHSEEVDLKERYNTAVSGGKDGLSQTYASTEPSAHSDRCPESMLLT